MINVVVVWGKVNVLCLSVYFYGFYLNFLFEKENFRVEGVFWSFYYFGDCCGLEEVLVFVEGYFGGIGRFGIGREYGVYIIRS